MNEMMKHKKYIAESNNAEAKSDFVETKKSYSDLLDKEDGVTCESEASIVRYFTYEHEGYRDERDEDIYDQVAKINEEVEEQFLVLFTPISGENTAIVSKNHEMKAKRYTRFLAIISEGCGDYPAGIFFYATKDDEKCLEHHNNTLGDNAPQCIETSRGYVLNVATEADGHRYRENKNRLECDVFKYIKFLASFAQGKLDTRIGRKYKREEAQIWRFEFYLSWLRTRNYKAAWEESSDSAIMSYMRWSPSNGIFIIVNMYVSDLKTLVYKFFDDPKYRKVKDIIQEQKENR